jgi:hypothetical protein
MPWPDLVAAMPQSNCRIIEQMADWTPAEVCRSLALGDDASQTGDCNARMLVDHIYLMYVSGALDCRRV